MEGIKKYTIKMTKDERDAIKSYVEILDKCPIELSHTDYIDLMRQIAGKGVNCSDLGIEIVYE